MPSGRVHLLIGAAAVALVVFVFPKMVSIEAFLTVPIFLIYTLLPDIDIPTSSISAHARKFFLVAALMGAVADYFFPNLYVLLFAIVAGVVIVAMTFATHRRFFHSLLAGPLLAAPLIYVGWVWFFSGVLGYYLHLLADGEFFSGGLSS